MRKEGGSMSNKLALSINLGQGRVSVASGIVNDIPSIVIERLANPLPVGTEVPKEAEKVDFPIVLHFHSVEAIDVWRRQLDRIEKLLTEEENE
jgi:Ethanolamine utilization protein EutJ (predicted chaperonin)